MWCEHSAHYTARHDAAVRVLAWYGRAPVGSGRSGSRDFRFPALRASSHASRSMRAVRVPSLVPRWMCRTAAAARCTPTAGFLLSDHSGRAPTPQGQHGCKSRSAQIRQFLHYRRDCQVNERRQLFEEARLIVYCAFIQVSEPVSLTETSERKMCRGLPSAKPRCSVENRIGPAFL